MAALARVRSGYFLSNLANILNIKLCNVNKFQQALFHCSSFLNVQGMEIKMPSLSPTMMEGKIVKWLKKEGDPVSPGDVICDIETDKAVVSMEVEEEGVLAKILVPENTPSIKVGSLIALMVSEGEDWKSVEVPAGAAADETPSSSSSSTSSSSSSSSTSEGETDEPTVSGPPSLPITMPSLSPTMTAGTIVKWLKKEGDTISPGDVLCDIQTDKAIMSMETEEEGILAKILVPDDSKDVEVGTLIALIVAEGEDWKNVKVSSGSSPGAKPSAEAKPSAAPSAPVGGDDLKVKSYGPAVKALLSTYQLEPGVIKPTGRGNRILKEDVLNYIEDNKLEKKPPKVVSAPTAQAEAPAPAKPKDTKIPTTASIQTPKYVDTEISNMRMVIAKRLQQSKNEIPHSYVVGKCDVRKVMDIKDSLAAAGYKVSFNDLVTKATATALKIYPKANCLYINDEVRVLNNVDVCVAVATDKGLYTPIIKSTDEKTVIDICKEIRELAAKAKENKLKPEEFTGGTFTISNLGMFGITSFKAIINPPQCGILAVGGTITSLDPDLNVLKHVTLTLSYDRRALQDHEAVQFMECLKYVLENPKLILFGVEREFSALGL